MRQRHPAFRVLLCGLLTIAVLAVVSQTSRADDHGMDRGCHVVAKIFNEDICYHDFGEDEETLKVFRKNATGSETEVNAQIQAGNLKRFRQYVWLSALVEKYGKVAIKPTQEEVATYHQLFKQAMDATYHKNKKTAALIESLLGQYIYEPQDRYKLEQILTAAKKSTAYYEARQEKQVTLPPEYQRIIDDAQKRIARTKVRQWKINKLLYDDYQGRIVLRDSGIEPVDAYDGLIRYIRNKGGFEIIDTVYEGVFNEIQDYIKSPVGIIPVDKEHEYTGYFTSPHWHLERDIQNSDFEVVRQKLMKVPTLGVKQKKEVPADKLISAQEQSFSGETTDVPLLPDIDPSQDTTDQHDLTTRNPTRLGPVPVIDAGDAFNDQTPRSPVDLTVE